MNLFCDFSWILRYAQSVQLNNDGFANCFDLPCESRNDARFCKSNKVFLK